MDLDLEVADNKIVLIMLRRDKYHFDLAAVLKAIEKAASRTCYICINDPYSFVLTNLKKNLIPQEKFFFIDTLTKKVQTPPSAKDCVFVSAPNALTEISMAYSKIVQENSCDGTLLDSISALMIYENPHSIIQFIHNLLTKIRISGSRAFLISLKDDSSSNLVKDIHMFVDKIVEIS